MTASSPGPLPSADRPYTIRRLAPADAAEFKRLRLRGLADHPDAFTSSVADWDLPLENFVERIEAGHVIGGFGPDGALKGHVFLATHAVKSSKTRHKCEVWSVYVAPEARGAGLAHALMEHVIVLARSLGYAWLKLQVAGHNLPAKRLYESLGFVTYGIEDDYLRLPDGRSITELMMQLKL